VFGADVAAYGEVLVVVGQPQRSALGVPVLGEARIEVDVDLVC
jgi:hypothetical protein